MMRFSRRQFLRMAAVGTCGSAIHNVLTPGFAVRALAQPLGPRAFSSNPLLIVCNLAGGPSYNIAPIYHSAWRDKNPSISYGPEDSIPINSEQGFHPSLAYFDELYRDGDLALLNKVGFSNHSGSHATAARMWMTGHAMNSGSMPGVLNQLSCQMSDSLFSAISLAGEDPIVSGSCVGARELEGLATLNGVSFKGSTDETTWLDISRSEIMEQTSGPVSPTKDFVRSSMRNMDAAAETIRDLSNSDLPNIPFNFPNSSFGRDCEDAAKVIQASLLTGTNAIYLERGGFDTHSNERSSMPGRLTDLNNGLRALVETVKALGRWQDTLLIVHGEFTRTFENSAQGSDHGRAAPVFVSGGRVNGGRVIASAPSNNEIASANGYLRGYEIDTRNLYSQIIEGMGYDSSLIFTENDIDRTNLGLFV